MTKSSEKNTSENTKSKQNKNLDLNKKVADLEVQLNEQKEITKQAQYSYVNLKMDFERLLIQSQEKEKNMELDSLIKIVKKFIPFVENLRKSLDIIPEKNKQESMAQWLQLMYTNFLKTLEDLNIYSIEAIGLEPDSVLHEPVNVQPVDDDKLKWKIVQEFQRGFIYKKDSIEKVIIPSKVVVWQ